MDPTPHEGDGVELLDWLFEMMENDGTFRHVETGHNGNHNSWPMSDTSMLESPGQGDGDFLTALLSGSDSAPSSPLWSPSHSDSGISEDPHSDQMDSPLRPESPPSGETPFNSWGIHTKTELEAATANINISNSWDQSFQNSHPQTTPYPGCGGLSSGSALTVKDLLLAGTADSPSLPSQQSIQELVLNEDERKLLAKEGVTLPSQLPLTKYEERILKKVRRKIRNKQSAQESRKKKKEYIDGLESRMAACNAHNQELQRKVSQLEKCNMCGICGHHGSLMQQLRRLQALVMNTSNRPAQTGTCVLVFLLSFSLILFPSLKPFSSTDVNQGDFSSVRVQSRSLQNLQASRVLHAINPQYTTEDEAQDDLPHRRFPGDEAIDHVNFLMKNLNMQNFERDPEPFSPNGTEEENVAHFHVDPITGHIATVTLDPQRPARLRPHADDM